MEVSKCQAWLRRSPNQVDPFRVRLSARCTKSRGARNGLEEENGVQEGLRQRGQSIFCLQLNVFHLRPGRQLADVENEGRIEDYCDQQILSAPVGSTFPPRNRNGER